MKKKKAVWQLIRDSLDKGISVMLLYVVESRGSSPGRKGFCMAITKEGAMEGSVGGGIMEHKLVEKARKGLQHATNNRTVEVIRQVHDKSVSRNQSGMICSGEQTVVMYAVQEKDKAPVNQVISCLDRLENGSIELTPQGIMFHAAATESFFFSYNTDEDWTYNEALGYKNHLYIIGGGHCALALSKLATTLDFYIHLFDDRKNLVTMQANHSAHEKTVVTNYNELDALIPARANSYVVVMTFGYRTDDVVVRTLLHKDFRYFGLLGSKTKIKKMFDSYKSEGVEENRLQKIHAPIGIDIKSETPEEIAVSIAAELIRVKNAAATL